MSKSGDLRTELSRGRRVVRWALRGALGMFALVALLVGLLHTGPGQRLLRARVEAALNAKMNGSASIGDLRLSLFSGLHLTGLSLKDATGKEVVSVQELRVELSPSKLLSGEVAVDLLRVHGVRLALSEVEGGGTNIGTLFKKTPPKPSTGPSKKSKRRISVGRIEIDDVAVTLHKLDGSSLAVSDVAVQGKLTAVPDDKTVQLELASIKLGLERKNAAMKLALKEFETSLGVDLVGGAGKVKLGRTSAKLSLVRPERPPFATPISFEGVELDVDKASLSASLERLAAGLALLDSLKLSGGSQGGALTGEQSAVIAGLTLSKDKVNALLGKELLLADVTITADLRGPPEKVAINLEVGTAGGKLRLTGHVDVSKLDRPAYDIALEGNELMSEKVVKSQAPAVHVEKITLKVRGSEIKKERIDADVSLGIQNVSAKGLTLKRLELTGRYERGTVKIKSLIVEGLGQKLEAEGSFVIASRELSLVLRPSGDIGKVLAALSAAGIKIKTKLPPGGVVLLPDETRIAVRGNLNDKLVAQVETATVRVGGGSIRLTGEADLNRTTPDAEGKSKFTLAGFSGDVRFNSVGLASILRLRGKRLEGYDGRINGRVQVSGTKTEPKAKIDLSLKTAPDSSGRRRAALVTQIKGDLNARRLVLEVDADRVAGGGDRSDVVALDVDVPLDLAGKRLRRDGRLAVKLDLPRRKLSTLHDVLPDSVTVKLLKYPDAEVEGHADIHGTANRPQGDFALQLDTELPLIAEPGGHQRLAIKGQVSAGDQGPKVASTIDAWLDHRKQTLLSGKIDADVQRAKKDVDWRASLQLTPPALEELPSRLRRPGLKGRVALNANLAGNKRDVTGRVSLDGKGIHKGELGPLDLDAKVDLGADATHLEANLDAAGGRALELRGTLGVAGKNLIPTAKERRLGDPTVNATLDVVRRPLRQYGALRPKLAKAPGEIAGRVVVSGTAKQPLLEGDVALDRFTTLAGTPGRAGVHLRASEDALALHVDLGLPRGSDAPVSVRVNAPRAETLALLKAPDDATRALDVRATARAKDVSLKTLVPKSLLEGKGVDVEGALNWNMDGRFQLSAKGKTRKMDHGSLRGALSIDRASASLFGGKRRYHDVRLTLKSDDQALSLEELSLAERDLQKSRRSLKLSARVPWRDLRPERVELSLAAKDWLLFGGSTLGSPDAPRAALTSRIDVKGELGGQRRQVYVTVRELDLNMPDRFNRAHWPEDTHLGDVMVLGDEGVALGKLPVPEAVKNGTVNDKPPPAPSADSIAGGTDVHLSILPRAHIEKPPFELYAHGSLVAKIRPGLAFPEIRGELPLTGGAMSLGGRLHPIAKGKKSRIVFDERSPRGRMETHLLREAEVAAMRDVSKASAEGDTVRLYLEGPIGKPVSKVNGAANADLWDMLPVYNAGRVKWTSQPDLAASSAVQIPRQYDVILISYMAVNLPHNLFLDRINAWSDPDDARRGYGQVRHLEAERSSKSGKTRVVTTARPPSAGRSDAEFELDYMFVNGARTKAGVGVAVGNRVGGGPALFFDWSSED
ncbi:MAG: AsmA family protein [Polyangiaceae bacterium]